MSVEHESNTNKTEPMTVQILHVSLACCPELQLHVSIQCYVYKQ